MHGPQPQAFRNRPMIGLVFEIPFRECCRPPSPQGQEFRWYKNKNGESGRNECQAGREVSQMDKVWLFIRPSEVPKGTA